MTMQLPSEQQFADQAIAALSTQLQPRVSEAEMQQSFLI
jgi:hypothetical protein